MGGQEPSRVRIVRLRASLAAVVRAKVVLMRTAWKRERAGGPLACPSSRAPLFGRHGYPLIAHPLIALLHVGWTAERALQAHLSAFSAPLLSTQPLDGCGSVSASEYS
jgi:hypothetical protein